MESTTKVISEIASFDDTQRWRALIPLQLGDMMIIVDTTIVNLALASIKADLHFSDTSLVWVVNAYMVPFAGFMLLGGRLGDLFGQRRLFLLGITVFTLASLGCGLARTPTALIAARVVQGLGGAVVSATVFSLTMSLFTDTAKRAKAIGLFAVLAAGGGSAGLLLGGTLTTVLGWHWIFLVNVPIGAAIYVLTLALIPNTHGHELSPVLNIDVMGAMSVTSSLMLATYAVLKFDEVGWWSLSSLGLVGAAVALFFLFVAIENRSRTPLVPLELFHQRNLAVAAIALVLLCTAMTAWYYLSSLYLRRVLGLSALTAALIFLPANLITAASALSSSKLVMRIGIKRSLAIGLLLETIGLLLLARVPVSGRLIADVLPPMIILALGSNLAFTPLLLSAMGDVKQSDSGIASGVINTTFTMGQTFGLALLVSIAVARTDHLLSTGNGVAVSLTSGYHVAFLLSAILVAGAAACSAFLHASPE